ncbi:MAG: zinc ribbon domain-containing protein [Promethearchaeota archaeon]
MSYCPKCGTVLKESWEFCGECGYDLTQIQKTQMEGLVNVQSNMEQTRSLGLECLKCGSTSFLTVFNHSETVSTTHRRYTSYKTRSIRVPLCENCNRELSLWSSQHKSSRSSYYDVITSLLCGLAFGIGFLFVPIPLWPISIIIFVIIIAVFIYMAHRQKLKHQDDSPHRYIKFRGQRTYVKPRGEGEWIRYDAWLNYFTQRDAQTFFP